MNTVLRERLRVFLPRRIKPHRIRRGPLAGHRIVTSWHDYPGAIGGTTEAPLLEWFARNVKPAETWLDIGAHYGYTSIALSRLVGAGGRVIAFEPVAATAGCVSRTRELNGLTQLQVVPLGLSSTPGVRPVHLPVFRGMADSTLNGTGEIVFVSSFDHLWETLSDGKPCVNGVKIDVQGMEFSVLSGMKATLRRCHPRLVVEFHSGVARDQILNFLGECGYSRDPHPIGKALSGSMPDNGILDNPILDNESYAFYPVT